MNIERMNRVAQLFREALPLDADDRERLLGNACGDDVALRAEVESLLKHDRAAGSEFMPPLPASPHEPGIIPSSTRIPSPPDVAARAGSGRSSDEHIHIEGYQITRELSRGGQGVVYQAIQKTTKRKIAIKVIREGPFAGKAERARFEREVDILGQLRHPNVVAIHDKGTASGCSYYVMDYISGQPLDVWISQQDRAIDEVLKIFAKICEAINAAHLKGIIHRDLKPGNIRIDDNGEPHILDFGLAKVAQGTEELSLMTMTGQFMGSLPWSSPEQAEAKPGLIDVRTDVYSLGVILYQMLTGKFPYEVVGNMRDVLDRILKAEPAKPSTIRRQINDEVETIVLKCLSKERERRYQSAGELARDIRHYLAGEPIEAKRDSGWYVLRKNLRRNRGPVVAAAIVTLSLALGAVGAIWQAHVARQEAIAADAARKQLGELMAATLRRDEEGTPDDPERLEHRAAIARRNLAVDPLLNARELRAISYQYLKLGLLKEAESCVRTAISTFRKADGSPMYLAAALSTLSGVLISQGKEQDALPLLEEEIGIRTANDDDSRNLTAAKLKLNLVKQACSPDGSVVNALGFKAEFADEIDELGRLWRDGDRDGAFELIAECVRTMDPDGHGAGYVPIALFNAGVLFAKGEDWMVAEPLFLESLSRINDQFAAPTELSLKALRWLSEGARASGNAVAANDYVSQALKAGNYICQSDYASPAALNEYAWLLLTCEPAGFRDPLTARGIAERAVRMSGHRNAMFLDTLALAYSETGDSEKAAETQSQAVRLVPDSLKPEYESRRDKYREGLQK